MKTDVIVIHSDMQGKSEAMREAERFAAYNGLTGKPAMHIRLLTEETLSMVHGIVDDFKGDFWLESEQTKDGLLCRICLAANVAVSERQEEQLLDVSTTGKNEEAKGILGKIREIFRWGIQQTDAEAYSQSNLVGAWYALGTQCNPAVHNAAAYWSLQQYTQNLRMQGNTNSEAWDELEKSIIAKLADEVKVGIRSERTEVIIEKCFPV